MEHETQTSGLWNMKHGKVDYGTLNIEKLILEHETWNMKYIAWIMNHKTQKSGLWNMKHGT